MAYHHCAVDEMLLDLLKRGRAGRRCNRSPARTYSRARKRAALPGSLPRLLPPTGLPGRRASASGLRMDFQETLAKRKRSMLSATMQTFAEVVIMRIMGKMGREKYAARKNR